MDWKGRRQSNNVEDQRGPSAPGPMGNNPFGRRGGFSFPGGGGARRAGGGLSIGTIIFLVVIYFVLKMMGIDLLQVMDGGGQATRPSFEQTTDGTATETPQEAERKAFMATVLAETEDTWNGIFQASGETYVEPKLVLFRDQINSACGFASSATGPFYCPGDSKVYLDMGFFDELAQKFDAEGDFAQAYVLAHEVGHHIQNLTGVLPDFNRRRQSMSEAQANAWSVRVELQADCYAGIWGKFTEQKGLLESGDLQEALNAATQIGDDTLQRRTQGYVVPESFNHGTSAQRQAWFKRGFDSGRVADCDTFSGNL